MTESVSVNWLDGMAFEAEVSGHKIVIDAVEKVGGQDRGARPKPFMMLALAGCTAMDVISILKKMRVDVKDFKVKVDGDLTEEHPKRFHKMHVIYEFTGSNLPMAKLQKAITLSEDRYCGVSASYKMAMELTSEIVVNEA